jgi:outer membrane protein TolC
LHQVAEQVIALRAIDAQIATAQQALDSAQSAYDLGNKRYRSGVSAYLDVLSVEQPLLLAQEGLADLHAQRIVASVKLAQALGGGFHADGSVDGPPSQSVAPQASNPPPTTAPVATSH